MGLNITLALIVLLICIEIEILNHAASGYLPRKDLDDGKWRTSPVFSEESWRRMNSMLNDDKTLFSRPLTAEEQIRMEREVFREKTNNSLRSSVSSLGLMQYILAPLSLIYSLIIALRSKKIFVKMISAVFALSSGTCMIVMLYRGYFTSLGW